MERTERERERERALGKTAAAAAAAAGLITRVILDQMLAFPQFST